MFLKANGALRFVAVVEDDSNTRFGDARLAALVDEILQYCQRSRIAFSFPSTPTCKFCARTTLKLLIPSTKHIESRMFDLPEPLSPVIELKLSSLFTCQWWIST
jgi:hypothetical protein